ncbi:methionyl-tRNA formyltransferase [bacterium]|nr:methionyl-tRNA formyltransferase [bacterium]
MRVLYMGTPQFAVPALEQLNEHFEVIGVVTQPDKPKGRGRRVCASPVKLKAQELGLPVYQPLKVRDPEFCAAVKELKPDIILVAAYAKLIPKEILELPKYGCINLHPSLLPRHRGAIPVQAAIMAGDKVTGVTSFVMEEGYDTGPLLMQEKTEIKPEETGSELLERLSHLGAELLIKTAVSLEKGELKPVPQTGEFNYTKPLKGEDLLIDWHKSAEAAADFVRALYSEPESGTFHKEQVIKVGKLEVCGDFSPEVHEYAPGQIVGRLKGKGYVAACGSGFAVLRLVKPAGKGWMDGAAFMAGRRLQIGDILGC